jgi:protein-tyrosine phosphatase
MNYSFILPKFLAQGSRPENHSRLYGTFDVVVLCAHEDQDIPLPGVEVVHVPLDDDPNGPPPTQEEVGRAWQAAKTVAKRMRQGKRVLVTCHMGLNRSAIVTGFALVMLGFDADDAIRRVRSIRGERAFSNHHFVELLRQVRPSQDRVGGARA